MSHAEMLEFWLANNRQTEGLANFVLQQSHRKLNQIMEESIRKKIKNFVAYVNFHLNKCIGHIVRCICQVRSLGHLHFASSLAFDMEFNLI